MKMPKHEFIRLQQEWYERLSDNGFKDIEEIKDGELVLQRSSAAGYRKWETSPLSRALKEEYYRWIAQEANDETTVYRNDVDQYILIRHCEGARIKHIVKELETKGTPRHRHSVRFIIRKYEIEWGIKKYNERQLNIKKKA